DVDAELAAVWRGYDHGVVTEEEVHQRLDELERLLWRQVFQRLRRVQPPEPAATAGGAPERVPAT
ncbi:MAG TPA: hypothetical protein VEP73_10560, partial [Actinomycetota bacterium]|nr:hypothetical protein [Actinomycetota bacterium]